MAYVVITSAAWPIVMAYIGTADIVVAFIVMGSTVIAQIGMASTITAFFCYCRCVLLHAVKTDDQDANMSR